MRNLARLLAAVLLAVASSLVPAATAQACSCSGLGTAVEVAETAAAGADLAFIGRVVEVRADPFDLGDFGEPAVAYAFEVRSASAAVAPMIEVVSGRPDRDSCGSEFGMDEEWFVTGFVADGRLRTALCSGNLELRQVAPDDVARLTRLAPIEPEDGSRAFAPSPIAGAPIAAVGGLVLVAGLVALVAFRRGRVR